MHSSSSRRAEKEKDRRDAAPTELPIHGNYIDHHVTRPHRRTAQPPISQPQPPTLYIPIERPPTPAPSPEPSSAQYAMNGHQQALAQFPAFPAFDMKMHMQNPLLRRQYLSALLASCTPQELLFISQTIAPLLKRDFLLHLPPELALHVLSFIDEPRALMRAAQVSRQWYRIVRDESVWRRMCWVHGFDDWGGAEVQWREALERKEKRRGKGQEKESGQGSGTMFEDTPPDESGSNLSSPPLDPHTRRRSTETFSFRRHFKNSYIIRMNWRKGGKLLNAHRMPIVSPDTGTVTSLALDADWVVVGLANSMIKVFSARTGVLGRTLVGHESGVWGVCLVSKGGQRAAVPGMTGDDEERRPKRKGKEKNGASEASASVLDGLSNLNLNMEEPKTDGTHVMPSESLEHLVPPSMQIALGLNLLDGDSDSSTSSEESPRSSSVFDEGTSFAGVGGSHHQHRQHRDRRRHWQGREQRKDDAVENDQNGHNDAAEEEEIAEDSHGLGANPGTAPFNMGSSSQGWGQPNSIIVSGGCDKTVRVWDAKSGQCIYVLHGHTSTIRCIRMLHSRPVAVTGSRDATLRVWDVQLGRCLRVLAGHQQSVRCLDVCGNRVVSGSYDSTCRLWDIDTGECLHVLQGHFHQVYSVAFDGTRIASGGLDTTVRIWSAETGECIALLQGHTALVCELQLSHSSLASSSSSTSSTPILATGGSDGRVITFSLLTYKPLHKIFAHDSSVTSLQFDAEWLVTGGNDGRVRLFETGSGKFVRELSEKSESVWKVGFGGGSKRDVVAVMCKRAGKTVVEIWSLRARGGGGRGERRGRDVAGLDGSDALRL